MENFATEPATKTSRGSESEAKEIESLGIDLLFEYATTIEHLKSISDDDFETLKDTIIKVDLVSWFQKGGLGNTPKIYKKGRSSQFDYSWPFYKTASGYPLASPAR